MKSNKGFGVVVYLFAVAVLGVAAWIAKPSLMPGASRRAAQSVQASARVETATKNQGAEAAASVAKIGEAAAESPESPARDFITREVPVALSMLPPPDPAALLAAEKRKVAVMSGQLDEARHLYEAQTKQALRLQGERDAAVAERNRVDSELEKAAAASHAKDVQLLGLGVLALLAFAGFVYLKIYHISPATLGVMAAEIRSGGNPIQVMTDNLAPRHYSAVTKAAKLATPLTQLPTK